MRPEKANIVSDLSKDLKESSFVLVTDYQHMKVDDFSELRKRLAAAGAEVHVVKNSFLKRAMADSGLVADNGELTGQTAVVTGEKDVAPVAKILKTFAGEFKKGMLKLGFIDRAQVPTKEIEQRIQARYKRCVTIELECKPMSLECSRKAAEEAGCKEFCNQRTCAPPDLPQ